MKLIFTATRKTNKKKNVQNLDVRQQKKAHIESYQH